MTSVYELKAKVPWNWCDADIEKPPPHLIVNGIIHDRIVRCYYDGRRNGWFDQFDKPIEIFKWRKITHINL
jgi:hypothetical protein